MSIPISPAWLVAVMAIAIGLLLVLGAFGNRLPAPFKRNLERVVSIGYPAIVGAFFVFLSWTRYQEGETGSGLGFAVGAVLMVGLTARAWLRERRLP